MSSFQLARMGTANFHRRLSRCCDCNDGVSSCFIEPSDHAPCACIGCGGHQIQPTDADQGRGSIGRWIGTAFILLTHSVSDCTLKLHHHLDAVNVLTNPTANPLRFHTLSTMTQSALQSSVCDILGCEKEICHREAQLSTHVHFGTVNVSQTVYAPPSSICEEPSLQTLQISVEELQEI